MYYIIDQLQSLLQVRYVHTRLECTSFLFQNDLIGLFDLGQALLVDIETPAWGAMTRLVELEALAGWSPAAWVLHSTRESELWAFLLTAASLAETRTRAVPATTLLVAMGDTITQTDYLDDILGDTDIVSNVVSQWIEI